MRILQCSHAQSTLRALQSQKGTDEMLRVENFDEVFFVVRILATL